MRRHEVPIITVIFNNRSYNETRNRMWSRGKNQREKKLDMVRFNTKAKTRGL